MRRSRVHHRSAAAARAAVLEKLTRAALIAVVLGASAATRAQVSPPEAAPASEVTPGDAMPADAPGTVAPKSDPDCPFRAHRALGAPTWLRFGLEQRTRFEHLSNDYRGAVPTDANGVFLRTLVSVGVDLAPASLGLEVQDSRAYASADAALNDTFVNPLEILRATAGLSFRDVFRAGDTLSLTLGRQTLDFGSRRLIARNGYRNTINGFTGLDAVWARDDGTALRLIAVMPVTRAPSTRPAIDDNAVRIDRENPRAWLGAAGFETGWARREIRLDGYVIALVERDSADTDTSDRRLVTPGARLRRAARPAQLSFEAEGAAQLGRSHASRAPDDVSELTHFAYLFHGAIGYQLAGWAQPHFFVLYDHASGDRSPRDGQNGRFDSLFGARVFDYGPTGMFGALARSNLRSPGARVKVTPHPTISAESTYRLAWLAQPKDAWTTAGLRDETGDSETFLGHQLDGRVAVTPWSDNLALEVGAALFARGTFARTAPAGRSDATGYFYLQLTAKV